MRQQISVTNTRVYQLTDDKSDNRQNVASHVNRLNSIHVLTWYFAAVVTLLVAGTVTNTWTLYNGPSSVHDVTETEMLLWQLLFIWDITYITYDETS
jgi:hypothetical protein